MGGNGFRAVGVVDVLETDLGRPVTANHVLLWHALGSRTSRPESTATAAFSSRRRRDGRGSGPSGKIRGPRVSAAATAHGYAYGLAWSPAGVAPRWLGWLGLVAGALLVLTPLAVTAEVLFFPFFIGTILTLAWLLAAGLWLALRPPGAGAAVRAEE